MATIKGYTDIEQSKKLAEILPLESADMHYNNGCCRGVDYINNFTAELMCYNDAKELLKLHKTNFMFEVIPCWSLAALLSVIPDRNCVYKKTYKDGRVKYQGVAEGLKELILKDNPIDACYEMILKLHELKML